MVGRQMASEWRAFHGNYEYMRYRIIPLEETRDFAWTRDRWHHLKYSVATRQLVLYARPVSAPDGAVTAQEQDPDVAYLVVTVQASGRIPFGCDSIGV